MSRSIDISYRDEAGVDTCVEVRNRYYLLGTQRSSMAFWAMPRIREIGVQRLAELGFTDPVYFFGWEDIELLGREIALLGQHLSTIDYPAEVKATWLSHLTYCYHLLVETAPKESTPVFGIG